MTFTNAEVERGFSIERTVKHRLTNRLKIATLDSLLRVKLNGPTDVFGIDYDKALDFVDHGDAGIDEGNLLHVLHNKVGNFPLPAFDVGIDADLQQEFFADRADSELTVSEHFVDVPTDAEEVTSAATRVGAAGDPPLTRMPR